MHAAAFLCVISAHAAHSPTPSAGCSAGISPPVTPGAAPARLEIEVPDATQPGGKATRAYFLQLPAASNSNSSAPAMVVFDLHGYYDTAKSQISENRLAEYVRTSGTNAIVVSPAGSNDGGDSATWNMDGNGLNTKPGPMGDICEHNRRFFGVYKCYTSCTQSPNGCNPHEGCDNSSCMDDKGFLTALLDHLEASLCVDTSSVHFTGISTGAMMVLTMALHIPDRIASVVSIAGSRFLGFNTPPTKAGHKVSFMDVHGFEDNTIPANASNGFKPTKYPGPHGSGVSNDGFYYTPIPNITSVWAENNGCDNSGNKHFATKFDGVAADDDEAGGDWKWSCNLPHGDCGGADVVQCTGQWDHTWPFCPYNQYPCANTNYAELTIDFMQSHPKLA